LEQPHSTGSVPNPGGDEPLIARGALRTPRSAALAGIIFAVLVTVSALIIRLDIPSTPGEAGQWLSDNSRRHLVVLGLSLIPFGGIAFLWFIGVVRDRVGQAEDRFFATVFLGSGLLFTAMLFAATATASALVSSLSSHASAFVSSGTWDLMRQLTHSLVAFAMRMAAVFTIAGSTILRRTDTGPPWLVVMGYAIGVVLLFAISFFDWLVLLFPFWVFVLSLHILFVGMKRPGGAVTPSAAAG
jgi:hypothetical protein